MMIRIFHSHQQCPTLGVFTRLAAEHLHLNPAKLLINAVPPALLTNNNNTKHHPDHLEILIDQTATHHQQVASICSELIRLRPIAAQQQQTLLTTVTQKMGPWATKLYTA